MMMMMMAVMEFKYGRDGTHIDRDGDWQVQKFAIEWGMQI